MSQETEHHPWCNNFMRPREGCEMCDGLYKSYPVDGTERPGELAAKYFPGVVLRPGTGARKAEPPK